MGLMKNIKLLLNQGFTLKFDSKDFTYQEKIKTLKCFLFLCFWPIMTIITEMVSGRIVVKDEAFCVFLSKYEIK